MVRLRSRFGSASVSATIGSTSSSPPPCSTPGIQTGWTDLRADLSAYAGWQWSIFYRPERRRWRLVLSTDAVSGVPGRGVWGGLRIDGDRAAAREHVERAARMGTQSLVGSRGSGITVDNLSRQFQSSVCAHPAAGSIVGTIDYDWD